MDMSLQQLRMLREVANRGTIAAAAESMGYTASAVSQRLGGLEKSTGVAVLERVGRNVRLTDAGRELVRHADRLLRGMEEAQVAMERVGGEVKGVLDLTVYESVAATLLAPLLELLSSRYPDLHLRTRQFDPDAALDALAAGDIDLAFAIDYRHAPAAPRDDVVRYSVAEDRFHVAVPADDPLEGPVVALADLADRRFIASPPALSCGRCIVTACRDAGFEPNIVHQLDDYPTSLHLVAAGQGISLVPDLGLTYVPSGVRILGLDPPLSRTIQLAYRSASENRPAVVAVREALLLVAQNLELVSAAA